MRKTFAAAICVAIAGCSFAQAPQTAKELYELGNKQFKEYDKGLVDAALNPQSVDPLVMARQLVDGFNFFQQALPLDSMPNQKGEVKPKFAKKIANTVIGHAKDYFNAGGNFYNAHKFYPEAYDAFIIYATLPDMELYAKSAEALPDSSRSQAAYYAGVSAYSAKEVEKALKAFTKARMLGSTEPNAYIYEVACWDNIAQNDSTKAPLAAANKMTIAKAGLDKFGLQNTFFLGSLIDELLNTEKSDEALELVNSELKKYPDSAHLYGMLGFIYDRMEKDAESEEMYRKAAEMANADYETLYLAARKIYNAGAKKWDAIDYNSPDVRQNRENVKNNYFDYALKLAEKSKQLRGDKQDDRVESLIERIQYVITTNF